MNSTRLILCATLAAMPTPAIAQTPDTVAFLFSLGRVLRAEAPANSTLQLDFGCRWGQEICDSLEVWHADTQQVVRLTDTLQEGFAAGKREPNSFVICTDADRGPYAVFVRPPVFETTGARVLVIFACSVPFRENRFTAYYRGEEFTMRQEVTGWVLKARRLWFIT